MLLRWYEIFSQTWHFEYIISNIELKIIGPNVMAIYISFSTKETDLSMQNRNRYECSLYILRSTSRVHYFYRPLFYYEYQTYRGSAWAKTLLPNKGRPCSAELFATFIPLRLWTWHTSRKNWLCNSLVTGTFANVVVHHQATIILILLLIP